jgi:hypothetical protein
MQRSGAVSQRLPSVPFGQLKNEQKNLNTENIQIS